MCVCEEIRAALSLYLSVGRVYADGAKPLSFSRVG